MILAGRYAYKKYKESQAKKSPVPGENGDSAYPPPSSSPDRANNNYEPGPVPPPNHYAPPSGPPPSTSQHLQQPPSQNRTPQPSHSPRPSQGSNQGASRPRPSQSEQDTQPLWYPPKNNERLPYPVVLPQRKSGSGSCKFARAYAPVLADKGVNQPAFLEYLEKFELSIKNHRNLAILNLGPGGNGIDPSLFALFSNGSHAALDHVKLAHRAAEVNPFLDRMNDQLFRPRDMLCVLTTLQPQSSEVVKVVDVSQFVDGAGYNSGSSDSSGHSELVDAADLVFEQFDPNDSGQHDSRGATRLALRQDALYLMFVNLPTQRETDAVMAQDHTVRGSRPTWPEENHYSQSGSEGYESQQEQQRQYNSNNPFQQGGGYYPQQGQADSSLSVSGPGHTPNSGSSPSHLTHTHPPEPGSLQRADFTMKDEPAIAQQFSTASNPATDGPIPGSYQNN